MDRVRHEDICKFPHPEHVNYKRLRDRIRSGLSAVKHDDDRIRALWDWIGNTDSSNRDEHKNNCEMMNNHKGTCDWLLNDTRFQSWIAKSESDTCLWLTGPSGVGKTFLSSAAIEHVQNLPDRPGVVFEFVHFGHIFQKLEVLQRLASGLLKRVDDCRALTEAAISFRNRARQDAEEMKGLVTELLRAAAAVGKIFLFIDGINEVASELSYDVNRKQLDNEEKEAKDLVGFLLRCAQSEPNVRLWFSSQSDDRTRGWLEQDVGGHNLMASKASVVELNIPEIQARTSVAKFLKATIETHLGTEKFGESL
jgi:Cdc6-like AAA superfamily ATPase